MRKIIILATLLMSVMSAMSIFGQASAEVVSGKTVKINTTDPPNLSWVVGDFEVIKVAMGEAILAPIKQPLMPKTITVRYSEALVTQYPWFAPTQKLTLVIREGWVSQVFIPK